MHVSNIMGDTGTARFGRRALFSILPARTVGCLACARAALCGQVAPQPQTGLDWTDPSGMTWEDVFRFAYQTNLIPLLKELASRLGREKFLAMIEQASDDVVRVKAAGRPLSVPNLTALADGMSDVPPLARHALDGEIVERSAEAFEYRVTKCLWAKTFREEDAADIGYAMVCYPDYPVAKSLNPKFKLIRTHTLMQGADHCGFRYVMES